MLRAVCVVLGATGAAGTVPVQTPVRGWPTYIAMGAITDANPSDRDSLDGRLVDAVFKYAGDGQGDVGKLVWPIFTQQAGATATALAGVNKRATRPVVVSYTAQLSNGVTYVDWDNTNKVLAKHFANLILTAQVLDATGVNNATEGASLVLNPDMMGMVQQQGLQAKLLDPRTAMKIDVNAALAQAVWFAGTAHEWHLSLYGKGLDVAGDHTPLEVIQLVVSGKLQPQGVYSPWDVKASFETECERLFGSYAGAVPASIPHGLTDNFKGWVEATNWAVRAHAPRLTFGWQENVWCAGSDHWVHHDQSEDSIRTAITAPTLRVFALAGVYTNRWAPDFVVFDKYERDPIPSLAGPGYIWNARDWQNFMVYVKQMSEGLRSGAPTPVMLWQIPGGHLQTTKEAAGTEGATGPDYFLGNPDLAAGLANLQSYQKEVTLDASIYNCGSACSLTEYMLTNGDDKAVDWAPGHMDQAREANVFAILWGGGSTISVGKKPIDDHGWLAGRVNRYAEP